MTNRPLLARRLTTNCVHDDEDAADATTTNGAAEHDEDEDASAVERSAKNEQLMMSLRKMSRRVFGAGIILTGVLILGAALIIGLQFPKFVYDTNLEHLCIINERHAGFDDWVSGDHFLCDINRYPAGGQSPWFRAGPDYRQLTL